MIITIKVQLASGLHAREEWSCELEVEEATSLNDLHRVIQDAVGFDDDHMYMFFISRREFGSERTSFDDSEHSLDTKLSGLFPLPKSRKLFYWFDFGDDWIFQVSKTRKKPRQATAGQLYPAIVSESGKKPEQYPDLGW
jgi:hypothetical protein